MARQIDLRAIVADAGVAVVAHVTLTYFAVMRLNEVHFDSGTPVQGYGPGFFRAGDRVVTGAMLILPGSPPQGWSGYDDVEAVLAAAGRIDVLFVGTGADPGHPPAGFRAAIEGAGVGLEVMASPSACRSYNVVLGEGRRVALAVLPVIGEAR